MFKIGRRKKRIVRIFKKYRNSRTKKNNKKSKLKEAVKRVETSKSDTIAPNDDLINANTQRIKIKSKHKENREYVEKVRNQVKEVLEEKYDESFEKLFDEFERNGFINRDNFLFRLIFMILKKYGFIDILNENGEIDPNAIDTILKSIVKDAYKMISNDENDNAYKCHIIEDTGDEYNGNTYDDFFYEDEE